MVDGPNSLADAIIGTHPGPVKAWLASLRAGGLTSRIHNALAREGFPAVEEVTAVPDAGLWDVRGMGPVSINAIRDASAAVRTYRYPDDQDVVTLSGDKVRELASLL